MERTVFQEYITIRGARENNLKNVSLRIPKRKITIFTGVSGSGKSSIVFDTIATEARRQLNETFITFVCNFLPRYAQPDADAIENLAWPLSSTRNIWAADPTRRWDLIFIVLVYGPTTHAPVLTVSAQNWSFLLSPKAHKRHTPLLRL